VSAERCTAGGRRTAAIERAYVEDVSLPCDGAWPDSQVDQLQRWIDQGTPA